MQYATYLPVQQTKFLRFFPLTCQASGSFKVEENYDRVAAACMFMAVDTLLGVRCLITGDIHKTTSHALVATDGHTPSS
jgi:hypothetical protein